MQCVRNKINNNNSSGVLRTFFPIEWSSTRLSRLEPDTLFSASTHNLHSISFGCRAAVHLVNVEFTTNWRRQFKKARKKKSKHWMSESHSWSHSWPCYVWCTHGTGLTHCVALDRFDGCVLCALVFDMQIDAVSVSHCGIARMRNHCLPIDLAKIRYRRRRHRHLFNCKFLYFSCARACAH